MFYITPQKTLKSTADRNSNGFYVDNGNSFFNTCIVSEGPNTLCKGIFNHFNSKHLMIHNLIVIESPSDNN